MGIIWVIREKGLDGEGGGGGERGGWNHITMVQILQTSTLSTQHLHKLLSGMDILHSGGKFELMDTAYSDRQRGVNI